MRSFHGLGIGAAFLAGAIAIASCGGDDGDDGQGTTSTLGTTAASESTDASSSSSATTAASSSEESSSGAVDESSSGGTTGGPSDPSYPAPDEGGACPPNHAPIMLPGGSVCAPFCAGADDPCPAPASGDATPVCTPFEQDGGSGTPCTTHDECPPPEACGTADTCVAVAFWGCRLECGEGQTCSDGMVCAGDACAYP